MDMYPFKEEEPKKKQCLKNCYVWKDSFSAPGAPAAMYLVRSVNGHKREQNTTFVKVVSKQLLCGDLEMSPSVGLDERKNTAALK
ncbi:hypothetical protein CDAR_425371 [Caerostris darwini]|uniref:Uncharacterized protein n=1 Tax=Caerostris darwini TaxID=1538125 RepID=A0AAV4VLL2_9ARAC|nr:hypothetical protein CDAR_425371 [Caerostris darwini]